MNLHHDKEAFEELIVGAANGLAIKRWINDCNSWKNVVCFTKIIKLQT